MSIISSKILRVALHLVFMTQMLKFTVLATGWELLFVSPFCCHLNLCAIVNCAPLRNKFLKVNLVCWLLLTQSICINRFIGDSKSYLSGLPWLWINVWAYFGRFFFGTKVTPHKCLKVKTKPMMGDGENWTNIKFKKTESMENLHLSQFSERSTERSPCI